MKINRKALPILFLSVPFTCIAANDGLKDGFRQFRWGSAPLQNMISLDKKANMDRYALLDEDKEVAGVKNAYISYSYYQQSLCRVTIEWFLRKEEDRLRITNALESEWGSPIKSHDGGHSKSLDWRSSSGVTDSNIYMVDDPRTKEVDWLISLIITDRRCFESAVKNNKL